MANKDFKRIDLMTGLEDSQSRLFVDPGTARIVDLSKVRLLRCGVDTVRQLYRGLIRPEIMALFEKPGAMVQFAGEFWHAGRVGRDSGYQYKLQNADLGFVLLIKNFNAKLEQIGPHLKIEVSPHAIDALSPERLQERMDYYAAAVMTHRERNQCAVHLALDLQGWLPPVDLVARLHCRARTHRDITGINQIEWATKSSVYGRGETSMFGSAGGVQLCIYNKTEQARATDKLDFWESVWRRRDSFDSTDPDNYDRTQDVWRIELRYHHSVIQQFASGSIDARTGQALETDSYAAFSAHLDGLWRYGLGQFKLLSRPGYFEPIWTLIRDDIRVDVPVDSLVDETEYKRYYKTSRGFSGKNVELFLGNFVSLLARERVGAKTAFDRLKEWECWPVIRDHYASKDMTERDLYKHIKNLLQERHVRWGRAI
ncbi:Uncharacterised protein [Stutzerimonas stutzeri]|uniref:hypothetical protein n=1 Tax=Stutzerimonas stutzeri subgroup TaxID=578833 RepID=UPI000C6D208D|nr:MULTISPECIES: hypothetical protein [Stutzerimonas stutzeri subgroup]MCQ2049306.1 hypothetical protein [Stutzerimonas kunmingensis]PKR25557.1 hypothetical protein CXK90_20530 [Stutzerimonas stutzeri]QQC10772.1 hypothetical protein I6I22_18350 [Stutzerimonas stutzeri]VEI31837.1 Uncharacterised protein [Stutzerimonas stutzeri]